METNKVIFDTNAQCCDISNKIIKKETMENGIIYDEIDFNRCPCADKVELILGDNYKIQVEERKIYVVKKKLKYPKTFDECCNVLLLKPERATYSVSGLEYKRHLIVNFQKLLICRDAYWKIVGNWKPYFTNDKQEKYGVYVTKNNIVKDWMTSDVNQILTFPTKEMRDVFYNNFKELIEECKELL